MVKTENTEDENIRIVRGRVDSLSLYEITDHELNILEKGISKLYIFKFFNIPNIHWIFISHKLAYS